jgi:hypothetical protein
MMLGGNDVATINNPQGRWNRGPNDTCPPDHFLDEQNLEFAEGQVGSRHAIDEYLNDTGYTWDGSVKRVHIYRKIGEANRLLILDANNNIFDSNDLDTPILTVGGMTDFACVTLFNRCYISPSNGKNGLTGEKIYVYTGSGTARAAAGSPPTGHTLTGVENVAAGKIEKGDHLFAFAYEYDSGFITAPGLETGEWKKVTSAGDKKVDIGGIPTDGSWPSGVVAIHLLSTTLLAPSYNGNPKEQAWFFIPDGRKTTTTGTETVSFYDADLLTSADYLQYQKSELPAGAKLGSFQGRLVVCGPAVNDNIVWVSKSGEPEAISDRDGFIIVDPGDMGGGVRNALEHRGILFLTKNSRTYATADNGSSPSTWSLNLVDSSIGCDPLGDSALLDTKGSTRDQFVIAHRSGLYAFTGGFSADRDLAWKIRDDWRNINPNYFYLVQVAVDPILERIYVAVPNGTSTECDVLYVGDYQQGFNPDAIRWSKWALPKKPTSIWVEINFSDQASKLRYGSSDQHLFQLGTGRKDLSGATLINAYARFGQVSFNKEGAVNHYTALRLRARGYGLLDVTLYSLDDALTYNPASFVLVAAGGREQFQYVNVESEECSVKVGTNSTYASNPSWFTLTHLRLAGRTRWSTRPNV